MKKLSVKTIVTVGMLSSIAYILTLLNFPIPPFPNFLLIDFSDIPALIAALSLGPVAGVLVELFKNILNYFMTGSATGVPVGQVANFIAGISFVLPTYYLSNKLRSYKGMSATLILSSLIMAIIMSVLNYYIFLPAYTLFLHMPEMSAPATRQLIVTGILPFNIIKGVIVSMIFMLLFARMQKWINKQRVINNA